MRHLKTYKIFESKDLKWSDRDVTNKYFCALGWVRYTDAHQDSYIDIERHFDITWDHLGWILEDLVNTCDLLYNCSARDSVGRIISHPDSDGVADNITIEFIPEKFERVGDHCGIDFKKYMSKFSHFPPREEDVLYKLLQGIEDKLDENFSLTIKDTEDKFNIFLTSSQLTLRIKRKLERFNENNESDELYKDLTDRLFFEIDEYFEDKKRFFPLKVKLGRDSDGSYFGSVCMSPELAAGGWAARMNDDEEDWLFDLLKVYRENHGISYSACADSHSGRYFYEIKNESWSEDPFPERLD